MRALPLAAGLILFLGPTVAGAQGACLKAGEPDQAAEGQLVVGRFQDAAGRPERAFILQLRAPACLQGPGDFDTVDKTARIHVFSTDVAVNDRLRRLTGKAVRVRGEPFGEHTAHHHAPIVMNLTQIEAR